VVILVELVELEHQDKDIQVDQVLVVQDGLVVVAAVPVLMDQIIQHQVKVVLEVLV
jgi:hypothetical protein